MPIPAFDHNLVVPPHIGNPADGSHLVSPYPATTVELVQRFATSSQRVEILKGFINFRERLQSQGLIAGFQWLDGSFLEDIEKQENRAPNDLDLITFYYGYDQLFQTHLYQQLPEFRDRDLAKQNFGLDHFGFDTGLHPEITIEITRYWVQIFTHNRNKVWKGMVRIELNTPVDDAVALQSLLNWKTP
jgi:hypothetical protein